MKLSKFSPLLAGLALSTALMVSPAFAEVVKLTATLDGAHEVPPTDSAGKGKLDASYDTESKKLDWTLEYSELTGPAVAAHFHGPAAVGENADVQVPIADTQSGAKGSAVLTDEQAKDLLDGKYYVNVHTEQYPDGEIRGQVEKVSE